MIRGPFLPEWCTQRANEYAARRFTETAAAAETAERVFRYSYRPDSPVLERRAAALLRMVGPAVSGEEGSRRTCRAACALILGYNLSVSDAFPLLADWNRTCVPPWPDGELLRRLEWANSRAGERGYLLRDDAEWSNHRDRVEEILDSWFQSISMPIPAPAPTPAPAPQGSDGASEETVEQTYQRDAAEANRLGQARQLAAQTAIESLSPEEQSRLVEQMVRDLAAAARVLNMSQPVLAVFDASTEYAQGERHARQLEHHLAESVSARMRLRPPRAPGCGGHRELLVAAEHAIGTQPGQVPQCRPARVAQYACGCWECPYCALRLRAGHQRHALICLTRRVGDRVPADRDDVDRLPFRTDPVWVWAGPAEQWRAVRERIRRLGPNTGYIRVRTPHGQLLVAIECAIAGAEQVAPHLAGRRLIDAIADVTGADGQRPVSSGGRWRRAGRVRMWESVGGISSTLQQCREILRQVRGVMIGQEHASADSGMERYLNLTVPGNWTPDHLEALQRCLDLGIAPSHGDVLATQEWLDGAVQTGRVGREEGAGSVPIPEECWGATAPP